MPAQSRRPQDAWSDVLSIGTDAGHVIVLRCARIAQGGSPGMAEARLMVTEKIAALAHVQWKLATGAYGFSPESMARGVLAHYARGVRANRRRLSSKTEREP